MFNIGPLELLVVLIIALIVLGPQRLPEVARSVGRGMREFRSALDHDDEDDYEPEPEPEPEPTSKPEPEPKSKPELEPKSKPELEPKSKPELEHAAAAPATAYQKEADSSEPSSSSSGRV